jgi:hypothetical protein
MNGNALFSVSFKCIYGESIMTTYTPSNYSFATGATAGTVTVAGGFNTYYTNGPIGEIYAIGNTSAAIIDSPVVPAPSVTGYQQLYVVSIQGMSSDYTASGYYGNITLTSKSTGQVIQFKIPQPPAGANNYGVDVQFTNGSVAFTANTSPSGVWTMWLTQGGSPSTWGNYSTAVPATVTGSTASALDLSLYAQNPGALNPSDTSLANFPTIYTLTTGADTTASLGIPGNASNIIINGALSGGAQTLTSGDTVVVTGTGNVLNATVLTGSNVTLGAWSGVQTFNLTNGSTTGSVAAITATGVTGLTSLDFTNSTTGITVNGLGTAPAAIGLSSTASGTFTAASTIAAATNLVLNVSTVGVLGAAAVLNLSPYSGATGYTGITINSSGSSNYLQVTTGATTETGLTVTGSGALSLSSGLAGSQNNITSIDASAMTAGGLTVAGAATIATGGGAAAYLGTGSLLTTFKGSQAGTNILDLSGTGASTVTGLTVTDTAAATNTVILSSAVASALSANLSSFSNVQNIGVYQTSTLAGASINDAYLNGAATIKLYSDTATTAAFGNVTVINAINGLTVDPGGVLGTGGSYTVGVSSATTSGASTLTVKFGTGSAALATDDTINLGTTAGGETTVNLVVGTAASLTLSGVITETSNAGQSGALAISGMGAVTLSGGVSFAGGSGSAITDTDTSSLSLAATNAASINASAGGGLIMTAADTSLTGAVITGATSYANTLRGSAYADIITGSSVGGDNLYGGAGANSILLGTHRTADTIWVNAVIASTNTDTLTGYSVSGSDLIKLSAASNTFVVANAGGAAAASNGTTTALAQNYVGAALTLVTGVDLINAVGMGAQTSGALLASLNTAGTAITMGTSSAGGANLLVEYLSSVDSSVHLASLSLASSTSFITTGATALTDIVITGQATALAANSNIAFAA